MSQMFDLIKQSAVPAAMMRSAAKGALSVPAEEMIEILVYLTRNPVFGQQAAMTLASWDEAATLKAVSGSAPQEVLDYFWAEINRRPKLMPALIENPRISEENLVHSAANGSREFLEMLKASPRAQASTPVLEAMLENPRIRPNEIVMIRASLGLEPAAQLARPRIERVELAVDVHAQGRRRRVELVDAHRAGLEVIRRVEHRIGIGRAATRSGRHASGHLSGRVAVDDAAQDGERRRAGDPGRGDA